MTPIPDAGIKKTIRLRLRPVDRPHAAGVFRPPWNLVTMNARTPSTATFSGGGTENLTFSLVKRAEKWFVGSMTPQDGLWSYRCEILLSKGPLLGMISWHPKRGRNDNEGAEAWVEVEDPPIGPDR